RSVAIASAELLRASLLELAVTPQPASDPVPVLRERARARMGGRLSEPSPTPAVAPPRWRSLSLGMAAVGQFFPISGLTLFGGRVAMNVSLLDGAMYFRTDLGFRAGTATDVLGHVDIF